ncbi:hypothetical protein GJ744_010276 [Endocarpon pusillum]|uniref:Uncharacterized protein n=1 Tax=Endocarpon pusillum TaxID=364733 RepID=A0A8H7AIC6_9EURO|nr:hypothetical protein GJ744_010276 [Endocarpon pusillum]
MALHLQQQLLQWVSVRFWNRQPTALRSLAAITLFASNRSLAHTKSHIGKKQNILYGGDSLFLLNDIQPTPFSLHNHFHKPPVNMPINFCRGLPESNGDVALPSTPTGNGNMIWFTSYRIAKPLSLDLMQASA